MYRELPIHTPHGRYSAFLQDGFFNCSTTTNVHSHNYAEVHIVLNGVVAMYVGDEYVEVGSGQMILIPSKVLHACIKQDDGAMRTAFQIDYPVLDCKVYSVSERVLADIFDEIKRCDDDFTRLSALIAVLCSEFCSECALESTSVTDYAFLISEFFSMHYAEDVRLGDLAELLCLSERQAERLVTKYMGKSFRETLADSRVRMAKQLHSSTDMSMSEIAGRVGYRSYAGFWKAMKNSK